MLEIKSAHIGRVTKYNLKNRLHTKKKKHIVIIYMSKIEPEIYRKKGR